MFAQIILLLNIYFILFYLESVMHLLITHFRCTIKKMCTQKNINLLLYTSYKCVKRLNFLSRIYWYTSLFSLRVCNIGNALGECAIILSGILCNTYLPYLQTSSTSFPLILCSFFLLLPPRILYLRS